MISHVLFVIIVALFVAVVVSSVSFSIKSADSTSRNDESRGLLAPYDKLAGLEDRLSELSRDWSNIGAERLFTSLVAPERLEVPTETLAQFRKGSSGALLPERRSWMSHQAAETIRSSQLQASSAYLNKEIKKRRIAFDNEKSAGARL